MAATTKLLPLVDARLLPALTAGERAMLRLLLPLALLHGLLYLVIVPPWQHYDEPSHFEYGRFIAEYGRRPGFDEADSAMLAEIIDSMYRFRFWQPGVRPALTDPTLSTLGARQHLAPPLYYTLIALPIRLVAPLGVEQQLYAARGLSLLFYTLTVIVAWRLACVLAPGEPLAQALLPLLVLFNPAFSDLMSGVNSDVLVNFCSAALLLGCALLLRDGPRPVGLLLALLGFSCALLAKRTALAALLPLTLSLFWAFFRSPISLWRYALVIVLAAAAGLVGSLEIPANGEIVARSWLIELDRSYLRLRINDWIRSVSDWERAIPLYGYLNWLLCVSFWVHLGWGQVRIGQLAEQMAPLLTGLAVLGLFVRFWQLRGTLTLWQWRCLWLFVFSGLSAWIVALLRVHPLPPPDAELYLPRGRYLFWALLPLIWLFALGLQAVVPARWRGAVLIALLALFVLLDLFAWAGALTSHFYR